MHDRMVSPTGSLQAEAAARIMMEGLAAAALVKQKFVRDSNTVLADGSAQRQESAAVAARGMERACQVCRIPVWQLQATLWEVHDFDAVYASFCAVCLDPSAPVGSERCPGFETAFAMFESREHLAVRSASMLYKNPSGVKLCRFVPGALPALRAFSVGILAVAGHLARFRQAQHEALSGTANHDGSSKTASEASEASRPTGASGAAVGGALRSARSASQLLPAHWQPSVWDTESALQVVEDGDSTGGAAVGASTVDKEFCNDSVLAARAREAVLASSRPEGGRMPGAAAATVGEDASAIARLDGRAGAPESIGHGTGPDHKSASDSLVQARLRELLLLLPRDSDGDY